ncbi:sodium/bile acid cotransporter [Etheostoma spectabile]|uniref:sodium/bile acid cotransporter n=1 Tax=Etheostoma spectabile TaxID=54343 RepID=UPI0013AF4C26|nr:sodium/bile acid cotransporter-like [Etheostoma spectabile]
MADTKAYTSDLFSVSVLWQNQSIGFNMTAANTSSVLTGLVSPVMEKIINVLMVVLLFITMVSLGCTMEVSKIKAHIVKPKGVAIAALAQYGVMPLTAFCLAKAFQLTEMMAVVVLICGCCPGGALSNILALALQGDMNLSMVMTSCSTVLALGMMPLLFYLYCQGLDLQNSVPYVEILVSLVMILIPCSVGILINYYKPQYAKTITKVGITFMTVGFVGITIAVCLDMEDSILTVLSPPLMAIGALMPVIGYSFGYIISWLFRLNQSERRTVAMETGCQNIQLCSTLLKLAFPPALIGPLFMFPMVYVFFQLTEAGLLIVLFRCHQRFTLRKKDTYQPAITEDKSREACEGTV